MKITKSLWGIFVILLILAGIVWVGGYLWKKVTPVGA